MPLFKRKAVETVPNEDVFLDDAIDADNSIFLHSLEELTADDLAPAKPLTLYDRIYNSIRTLLMIVCAVVFCVCLWMLVDTQMQSAATGDFYAELAGQIFADEADLPGTGISRMTRPGSDPTLPVFADAQLAEDTADLPGVTTTQTYNLELERMKAFLSDLRDENPDVFGYIRIDGTAISYPLVKGRDDEYYLHHQSNGQPSVSGAIYADTRCKTTLLEDRNLILYGHNMTNGTMFNNVTKFFDANVFYNTNIVVYTFDGIYTYEPFAIFSTNSRYPYFVTYFPETQTMIDFCNQMQANSRHNRGLTFTGDEQLLTLSTCTNIGDGRYALHARLIKVEQ